MLSLINCIQQKYELSYFIGLIEKELLIFALKLNELEQTVSIAKAKTKALERKHPWIFSGAIISPTEHLQNGDVVTVLSQQGAILGRGHFQHASIAVRMLTFGDEEITDDFFETRILNAHALRRDLNLFRADNNICRLVHGEGDNLPGLVVDYYNGVAVIQCHSIGMYRSINAIVEGLKKALGEELRAVYSKSADSLHDKDTIEDKYYYGTCETPHLAIENGVRYQIDWVEGQKTGFFIDQRENRSLLARYAIGKTVLNTFCYTGGFSLAALKNHASRVYSLDSSKTAIALTERNIELNEMQDRHESIVADAMHYMKDLAGDPDIIVLDPPAFAKHINKRHQAVQGYKRLNAHAIRQIKKGGIIFTFSCSQVVDKQLFTNTIVAAAIESGRNVRILEQLHQPADHPVNAFHPEGEYLKGLVIQVY